MSPLVAIDDAQLGTVLGGQNTSQWNTDQGSGSTSKTDYAVCTEAVRDACNRQSPGFLWGTDERKAGQCVNQNLAKNCGLPPTPQQGGQ